MTDKPSKQNPCENWLVERREACPPANLSDQVMNHVAELERQRDSFRWLLLVEQIERSRAARWAVCGGALAIGGLPSSLLALKDGTFAEPRQVEFNANSLRGETTDEDNSHLQATR